MKKRQNAMLSKNREGRITGSAVGALLGVNKHCSRQKAFRQIIGTETFEGNEATEWGNDHEEDCLNAFENTCGEFCEETLDDQEFYVHTKYNYFGCTPDGFTLSRNLVEFKCPFLRVVPDEVPPHYYAQVQFNMEVTGCTEAFLTYWTPEHIRVFQINYDPNYVTVMLEYLKEIYNEYIETKTEPPRFSKSAPKPTLPEIKWEIIHDRKI